MEHLIWGLVSPFKLEHDRDHGYDCGDAHAYDRDDGDDYGRDCDYDYVHELFPLRENHENDDGDDHDHGHHRDRRVHVFDL